MVSDGTGTQRRPTGQRRSSPSQLRASVEPSAKDCVSPPSPTKDFVVFFFFLRTILVSHKNGEKSREVEIYQIPPTPLPAPSQWPPPLPASPHQSGTCVTTETTLTHNCPKSVVYIRVTLGGVRSVGLDTCIITSMHHCNVESIFCRKNPLCFTYSSLPPPTPGNH